jgi:hypothetical protein
VTIKAVNLRKIGKKAFQKTAKEMVLQLPKGKTKRYGRFLTKSGLKEFRVKT